MSTKICSGCGGSGTVLDYSRAPIRDSNVTVSHHKKTCSMCGGSGSVASGQGGSGGCVVVLVPSLLSLGGALYTLLA
jgi:hypothetical protein